MSQRLVVSVADLEDGPKEVSFTLSEAWLGEILEPAGATPRGPGKLELELTKQGREVMVRGRADFGVTMPCVVTLEPVDFTLRSEIFLMLTEGKAPTPKGRAAGPGQKALKALKAPGATGPVQPKRRAKRQDLEPELTDEDAARDTFTGDEIVLDGFVRDFLLLELPLYPRRPDLPSAEEGLVSRPLAGPTGEKTIDPRLEPLAKLMEQLRGAANKE